MRLSISPQFMQNTAFSGFVVLQLGQTHVLFSLTGINGRGLGLTGVGVSALTGVVLLSQWGLSAAVEELEEPALG